MKIIAFIIAFTVIVLNCMPCMDGPCGGISNKVNTEFSKSCDRQAHSGSDACSPFCACNCCSGSTFTLTIPKIEHVEFPYSSKETAYISNKIPEISLPIWQPPKLAC